MWGNFCFCLKTKFLNASFQTGNKKPDRTFLALYEKKNYRERTRGVCVILRNLLVKNKPNCTRFELDLFYLFAK